MIAVDGNVESALFYTMSTIAQTLAAAMGLLGAIVLFALQETTRSIDRAARQLVAVPHEGVSALYINHLLTRRGFHELARVYGTMFQPGTGAATSSDALVHYSTLTWELDHDRALRRAFWTALFASGIVITAALICCGLAPELSVSVHIGHIVLGTVMAGAVSCLVLYGFLLRVMLRSSSEQTSEKESR